MTDSPPMLRLRDAVDREQWLVILIALLLVLAGGWLSYGAYATEDHRTLERTVSSWESTGTFNHQARVVNGTAIFDEGSILSDREIYFRKVTPVLNGSFVYTYEAEEGSIDATVTLSFVSRSFSEERENEETEYWRISDQLATRNATLSPGNQISVPFTINVTAAAIEAETAERQLEGTPGQIQHILVAIVDLEGMRNGESVDTTREYRLPIQSDQGVYRLSDPGQVLFNGSQTEQYTEPVEPGPIEAYGGPLLLAIGLIGLLGVAGGRVTGRLPLSEIERERLAHARERREFDDWITVARNEVSLDDVDTVDIDSLSGLVDFAIDAEERVVETPSGTYVVHHDGMVYTYIPPASDHQARESTLEGDVTEDSGQSGRDSPDHGNFTDTSREQTPEEGENDDESDHRS